MKIKALLALLAAATLVSFTLTACNGGEGSETAAATGTGADTSASTEAETAIPRYDYMEAEVAPDVTMEPSVYTDMKLTVPSYLKVADEDVTAYIENIRFQYRTAVNGTTTVKDKALALGDDAFIYYKGFVDGEAFEGGSNWEAESPHQLGLGSGAFIPGFEDALVGIIPNQTSKTEPAKIQVTFPEEYDEALAGKDAEFHVVVVYSVQYTMMDYNRQFVEEKLKYEPKKDFYASDAALLEEFEEYVYETLVKGTQRDILNAQIDALWNHLTEHITCKNLPATEVAFYSDSYQSEVDYYYEYYGTSGGEEFKKMYPDAATFAIAYYGFAEGSDWEAEKRHMAEQMVRKDMITHAIGELEGIESVTKEEFDAEVDYWVDYYYGYMTEADIIQNMGEVYLTEAAFAAKMQDWLLARAAFTFDDGTALPEFGTENKQ